MFTIRPRLRLLRDGQKFFPCIALLLIAAYQVVQVRGQGVTPWKAGGFGMFSTADTTANRELRIQLVKLVNGQAHHMEVELPKELRELTRDLRRRPQLEDARELAELIAALPWREPAGLGWVADPSSGAASTLAPGKAVPKDIDPQKLASALRLPRFWVAGLPSTEEYGSGAPIDFDRAVVEFWKIQLAPQRDKLIASRVFEAWSDGEGASRAEVTR